jgi:hypothetical protein
MPNAKSRAVSVKSRSAVVVEEVAKTTLPPEVETSPLYGVAMLKIAMELKKADARPLEELVSGVLTKMRLDEGVFRAFLEANGGLLRSIARKRGY